MIASQNIVGIKWKKTLQILIWDLKDAEEQSCLASNMDNMENNWDAPWRPSYSLAVVGGLSAVDKVEFDGWVPLNDPILGKRAGVLPRFNLG